MNKPMRANLKGRLRFGSVLAALAVAMTTVMAGCAGPGAADNVTENRAPDAKLTVNKHRGYNTDSFSFDGRESTDDGDNITSWKFSFGDGTTYEALRKEDASVSHRYAHGGEFVVTLTVTDDGASNEGTLTDTTSTTVAVNERIRVAQQAINAGPNNVSGESRTPIQVYKDADRFELSVTIQSTMVVGSSEFEVRLLDNENKVLEQETKTIQAQKTETIDLEGELFDEGSHTILVRAISGGGVMTGEMRVFYDRGFQD